MRVTQHAIDRFRDRGGFTDWTHDQIAGRLRAECLRALREGRTEPARGEARLIRFEVAGRRLIAIVADDIRVPGVDSVVTVFPERPRDAAEAAGGAAT
jgi:hypothetical protein